MACLGDPSVLCLKVKVSLFSSQEDLLILPTCEWWEEGRNTFPSLRLAKPEDILQDLRPFFFFFYFTSSPPLPLCSIKDTGLQTPVSRCSRTLLLHRHGQLSE